MKNQQQEAYKAYLDRLSMNPSIELLSNEEIEKYNKEHPLPAQEDIDRILREARS